MNSQYAWLMAGTAGITAAWGQIRGMFSRATSLLIVSVDIGDNMQPIFMENCWKHLKRLPLGNRKYDTFDEYIRPNKQWGTVACEKAGGSLTFLNGKFPVFVSYTNPPNVPSVLKVSYIRGTFNIEDFLVKSVDDHNEKKSARKVGNQRYYVRKVFGRNGQYNDQNNTRAPSGRIGEDRAEKAGYSRHGTRSLKWETHDLGAPPNASPFKGLGYSKEVMDIVEAARRWYELRDWYKEKGLAWAFSIFAHGLAGSGKTSLARAVGQELDLPIHIYDLASMSNAELSLEWKNSLSEAPVIILLEDIDRVFHGDKNVQANQEGHHVTMDCLLNNINGIEPSDGILLYVTANDPSKLDTALGVPDENGVSSRPGRLQRAIRFGYLELEERKKVAQHILSDCSEFIEEAIQSGEGETGDQFSKRCEKIAVREKWKQLS